MRPLGLGIVGAGKHGLRYIRHLTEDVPEARLVAICRRSRDEGAAVAHAHGCAFYDDWRALIADRAVDAVVAVVPPVLNPAIADVACAAGKHLLLEKPLAPGLDGARRIVDAVGRAGVRAMVAQTLRFDTTIAAVRAQLPSIEPLHAVSLTQRFEPSPLAWLDDPAQSGGGVLLHTGIHSIDLLRFLTGADVTEVTCATARVRTRETEDNFTMTARVAGGGILAQIAGSRALGGRLGRMELAGAGGAIVADHVHRIASVVRGTSCTPIALAAPAPTVREALRAFVRAVVTGAPMPVTLDDGLRAVAVVEAGYRSAALGGAPVAVTL